MRSKQQNNITALYCRLSKDDEYQGDSMSIQNQKAMLEQFAKEHGLTNSKFYIDDGFSGTNYDRPDFQRMTKDIDDGKVGTVIVKDLSRLGREYLQTGYYTEIFFPQNNVRFIAVNDNVDSEKGDNEFAPFKNIINDGMQKTFPRRSRRYFTLKLLTVTAELAKRHMGTVKIPTTRHGIFPTIVRTM